MSKKKPEYEPEERDVSLLAFDQYMREVRWIVPLTAEEEARLIACVQHGKAEREKAQPSQEVLALAAHARDRLAEGYQSLVVGVAVKYRYYFRSLELADVIQEGNVGLLTAIERYEPSEHSSRPFNMWLWAYVRGAVFQALSERDAEVRLHRWESTAIQRIQRCRRQLDEQLGRLPTLSELAAALKMDEEKLERLLHYERMQRVESLHALMQLTGAEDRREFTALFEAEVQFDRQRQATLEQAVEQAMGNLSDKHQQMIRLRYGLGGPEYKRADVARLCGTYSQAVEHAEYRMRRELSKALPAGVLA